MKGPRLRLVIGEAILLVVWGAEIPFLARGPWWGLVGLGVGTCLVGFTVFCLIRWLDSYAELRYAQGRGDEVREFLGQPAIAYEIDPSAGTVTSTKGMVDLG